MKKSKLKIFAGTILVAVSLCFIGGAASAYYCGMKESSPIRFFNRETKKLETEQIFGEGPLRWVYETPVGKVALDVLIRRAVFSAAYGKIMNRPGSVERIKPFIAQYGLDPNEFEKPTESFSSFNDFFSRKLKPEARPIVPAENEAAIPADGRHLAFQKIDNNSTHIYAKGQCFNLEKFIGDAELAKRYEGGSLICSRLCPTDYHRFHFPVAGTPSEPVLINGYLYSVNPIALSQNLGYLWENKRIRVEIDSPRFGKVLQVIVGATNVGTIITTFKPGAAAAKGDELGYFRFGGSFVATFFEPGKIILAEDLTTNTAGGHETMAKMGTSLGVCAE